MDGIVSTKPRKLRKDAFYSPAERTILNKHKEEYRMQPTRQLRGNVLRTKILPDLFNYWDGEGLGPKTEEESTTRMKVKSHSYSTVIRVTSSRHWQVGSETTGVHW
jgi:hypothetical protein